MIVKRTETQAPSPSLREKKPAERPSVESELHDVRPARSSGPWRWLWLFVLAGATIAAYFTYPQWSETVWYKWVVERVSGGGTVVGPRPISAIPVVPAVTKQGDMDLYLNGLGSVTAFYTVTLRTRVDGELMKVLFEEGEIVEKGRLLAEIDPRPFEAQLLQAEGQLTKDEAALKVAQLNLDRYSLLQATNSVTRQQIDEQKALVSQCQGAIQVDKGQIENIKLQLTYCHVVSPIRGRIGLRRVDPGNIVNANDPLGLAIITQLQPIAVVFTIPQDEIPRVQKKLAADAQPSVEAFDRNFTTRLATGKLLAVDNQVDATTGTVKIKAIFENQDNMLFPNQFVNARLLVDTRHDVAIAPTAAIQRGPNSNFVWVVKPDNGVELRTVVLGPTEGDQTAINSGLAANEVVVTDGVDKLNAKSKVTVRWPKGVTPPPGIAGTPAASDGKKSHTDPGTAKGG